MKRKIKALTSVLAMLFVFFTLVPSVLASDTNYKDAYKEVIDEYITVIDSKLQTRGPIISQSPLFKMTIPEEDIGNSGVFLHLAMEVASLDSSYKGGYALKDIDNDGIPELFINAEGSLNGEFGAVYTILNGQPRLLYSCSGMGSWHHLTKDNKIIQGGFTSGYTQTLRSYQYSAGKATLEYKYDYTVSSPNNNFTYTYEDAQGNTETISKADLEKAQKEIEKNYYSFNYKPLSSYVANEQPTNSESSSSVKIYRLYNTKTGEHLYTSDANEASELSKQIDWDNEGIGWNAPSSGTGVYRLYSPVTGVHLFTTDENEVKELSNAGWSVDNKGNPLFYSGGSKDVYRLYSPTLRMHLITLDVNEYNILGSQGWNQEGAKLKAQ